MLLCVLTHTHLEAAIKFVGNMLPANSVLVGKSHFWAT